MTDPTQDQRPPMVVAMYWVSQVTTVGLEMSLPAGLGYWLDLRWGTLPWLVSLGGLLGFIAVVIRQEFLLFIIGGVFGSTSDAIVPYLADGLVRVSGWDLAHIYALGQGHYRPLLILSPILARTFARSGWGKDDVKQALFAKARMPAAKFEQLIGEWSNINAGRRTLFELATEGLIPPVFGESDDPRRLVPIVTEASKFLIAVTGDPNRNNAYVMSNDGPHGDWTAKAVDRRPE